MSQSKTEAPIIEYIVCDASVLDHTGRGAAVALCSWNLTTVLLPELGSSTVVAEAIAAAMALENALDRLEQLPLAQITIHTDQSWLTVDSSTGAKTWATILTTAEELEEYLHRMLLEAKAHVHSGRLKIRWMPSHRKPRTQEERLMRHADAVAYLIASGAIHAEGELPRRPDRVRNRRITKGRNDPLLSTELRELINQRYQERRRADSAESRARYKKVMTQAINHAKAFATIAPLIYDDQPYVVVDFRNGSRQIIAGGETTIHQSQHAALKAGLLRAAQELLSDPGYSRIGVCIVGDTASTKNVVAGSDQLRELLGRLGRNQRIITHNTSARDIKNNTVLNALLNERSTQ